MAESSALPISPHVHLVLEVPWKLPGRRPEIALERFANFAVRLLGIQHLYFDSESQPDVGERYLSAAESAGLPVGWIASLKSAATEQWVRLLPRLCELVLRVQAHDDPTLALAMMSRAKTEKVRISVQLNCNIAGWKAWWPLCETALESGGWLSVQIQQEHDLGAVEPNLRSLYQALQRVRQNYPFVPLQVDPIFRAEALQHPCLVSACQKTHCHSGAGFIQRPYFVFASSRGEAYLDYPEVGPAFAVGHLLEPDSFLPTLAGYEGLAVFPDLFRLVRYVFQTYVARGKMPFTWWRRALQVESRRARWRRIRPVSEDQFATVAGDVVLREDDKGRWTAVDSNSTESVHISLNRSLREVLALCDGQHSIKTIVSAAAPRAPIGDQGLAQSRIISSLDHLQTMGLIRLHQRSLKRPTPAPRVQRVLPPMHLAIEVTGACNLRCWHCYANAGRRWPGEMSTLAWRKVLRRYALTGCRTFLFTGGEPLLRADIAELARYAAQDLGMRNNTLFTNASLLTPTLVETLSPFLAKISVSLDGPRPVHDAMRGRGIYERTMRGIQCLRAAQVPFRLQFSVTSSSWPHLQWLFDQASELGAQEVMLAPVLSTGRPGPSDGYLLPRECLSDLYQAVVAANADYKDGPHFATPLYTLEELEQKATVLSTEWFPAILPDGTVVPQNGLGREWELARRGNLVPLESPTLARFRGVIAQALEHCYGEARSFGVTDWQHMIYQLSRNR